MAVKDRRIILGGLAALFAAPFLLGRRAVLRTLSRQEKQDAPALKITPPAHSVKRRA